MHACDHDLIKLAPCKTFLRIYGRSKQRK